MEPIPGNERAIDLDYYASGSRRRTVVSCMRTGKPALTDRLRLVQETEQGAAFGVVLMHPGFNLSTSPDVWPRDLASIVVRIHDLLRRSTLNQVESSQVYIFDMSDSSGEPIFLGGVTVEKRKGQTAELTFMPEVGLEQISGHLHWIEDVNAANKVWRVTVVALPGTFQADVVFVILGAVIISVVGISLSVWIYTSAKRVAYFNRRQAEAEAEKAALILDNAKQAAKAERELNDFIA
jgi:hypothetical protein